MPRHGGLAQGIAHPGRAPRPLRRPQSRNPETPAADASASTPAGTRCSLLPGPAGYPPNFSLAANVHGDGRFFGHSNVSQIWIRCDICQALAKIGLRGQIVPGAEQMISR